MADSVRKGIFQNWEATLLELLDSGMLRTVVFGTFLPSNVVLPAAGFTMGEDTPNRGAHSISRQELLIDTVVVVSDKQSNPGYPLEDAVAAVKNKLLEDKERGGKARLTRLVSEIGLFHDKDFPQAGVMLRHLVDYATTIDDATVQVT